MNKLLIATVGASILTTIAQSASAITFSIGGTSVPGQGEFSSVPGVTTLDFESGAPTSGFATYSAPNPGPTVVSGSIPGIYAAPNNTKYLTVAPLGDSRGTAPVEINFAQAIDYFGLYWGSISFDNSISFYQDTTLIASFTGDMLSSTVTNIYANFFANPGEVFNRIVLNSTLPALESDNHAYKVAQPQPPTSVPEPTSALGLLALGTCGVSFLRKRKQQ